MRVDLDIIDGMGDPSKIKLGGTNLGEELKKQEKEAEEAKIKEKEAYLAKTKEQRYEDFLIVYKEVMKEK